MNLGEMIRCCKYIFLTVAVLMPSICHARGVPFLTFPENTENKDEELLTNKVKRMADDGLNFSLCPGGMDRMRCIHSYLSLYARIQNGLTDPVSLRNIGKRSSYDKKGVLMCPPSMDKIQCYDNAIAYYLNVMKMLSS